jgi:peptidoglycan/LPS O-acetylase OafA/YrhL
VDVFYWITAFVWSFTILKNIHKGQTLSIWKQVLGRYLRLAPLYYMMILYMWKYLSMKGGKGPRFYQFEEDHGCKETWFWHFTFLNNLFPWKQNSNCL